MTEMPSRDRWVGWVTLAWLLAAISIVGGIVMVVTMGSIEVPTRDLLGNVRWNKEPNYLVWGAAIGQALASILLAAIFSILNSIYQNSHDLLHDSEGAQTASGTAEAGISDSEETALSESKAREGKPDSNDYGVPGLTAVSVHEASPLHGYIRPGDSLLAVNGKAVTTELDAAKSVKAGMNTFTFRDTNWQQILIEVEMEPGPLHIRFA